MVFTNTKHMFGVVRLGVNMASAGTDQEYLLKQVGEQWMHAMCKWQACVAEGNTGALCDARLLVFCVLCSWTLCGPR